jgi:hypothetical protein
MADGGGLTRRDFFTRGLAGRVATLLGSGVAAAPGDAAGGTAPSSRDPVTARDLWRMSRDEVRQALRRIQRRTR